MNTDYYQYCRCVAFILRKYDELKERDSDDELLNMIKVNDEGRDFRITPDFVNKYGYDFDTMRSRIESLMKYFLDLNIAMKKSDR